MLPETPIRRLAKRHESCERATRTHGQFPQSPRERRNARPGVCCSSTPRRPPRRTRRSRSRSTPASTAVPSIPTSTAWRTPSTAQLNDLNSPLNRNGGNNTTRYNWQLNADNRGNDWYFESIGDSQRHRRRARRHVHRQRAGRRARRPMLTIPMIDWVAKLGAEPQQARQLLDRQVRRADRQRLAVVPRRRQRRAHATASTSPATIRTTPTSPSTSLFQQGWVQHLVGRWGTSANGGLRYYILDNEPSIWHSHAPRRAPDRRRRWTRSATR